MKKQKNGETMRIDRDRFEFRKIGKGRKVHIFPKRIEGPALCLIDWKKKKDKTTVDGKVEKKDVCKKCARDYPKVSRSALFSMFGG